MVYSCWEDRRKDEFLEVKVKCVASSGKDATRDSKVELLDINNIEQICIDGKYHELDLEPYVSYADKKKEKMRWTEPPQVKLKRMKRKKFLKAKNKLTYFKLKGIRPQYIMHN